MGFPETRAWAVIPPSEFVLVFVCLQAVLNEQRQYLSLLRELKDYDEELANELGRKAFQEQERQRLKVLFFLTMLFTLENLNISEGHLFFLFTVGQLHKKMVPSKLLFQWQKSVFPSNRLFLDFSFNGFWQENDY